ncbi:hypothetical protein BDE02_16G114400 [Populus trichocarpa]|nr:hypothetical protein BDE02_16G114400 [Populus trichocarpa]
MGQIISIKNCLQYLASGLGPVIWSITGNNSRSTWFYGPPSRHATGTVEASAGCQFFACFKFGAQALSKFVAMRDGAIWPEILTILSFYYY